MCHSYVKLPEGIYSSQLGQLGQPRRFLLDEWLNWQDLLPHRIGSDLGPDPPSQETSFDTPKSNA